ncbi:MAG: MotA/TolQ/ExbB proton channel family protein [Pseudomonadota bacterium]
MFELVRAGGWLMAPILLCSVIALAIIIERFIALRRKRVIPQNVVQNVYREYKQATLTPDYINSLHDKSPMEQILAAALWNRNQPRTVMKEAVEETGRQVTHGLERYLGALATIADITPLLGLLGTVLGMISVFAEIVSAGVGNPAALAGGISQALITTAAGLSVAIPAMLFHHLFAAKVDELLLDMEQKAVQMVDVLHRSNH